MGVIIRRYLTIPCHKSEAHAEEETYASYRIRLSKELISAHAVLVDRVGEEDIEERAEARDPKCERDVHGRHVVRPVELWVRVCGEDCGVEECPDSERELLGESGAG